jgi:hypothetical protein
MIYLSFGLEVVDLSTSTNDNDDISNDNDDIINFSRSIFEFVWAVKTLFHRRSTQQNGYISLADNAVLHYYYYYVNNNQPT